MFAASPKPLAIAIALTLCACATQTTVTGVIVDTHGRPVSQAVVTMVVRENRYSKPARSTTKTVNLSGVERMIMEQGQVGRDGRFSFTTAFKPSDLIITASSPDLKRSGRLEPVVASSNVLVVR
jgi:hypothetical protein